MGQTEEYNVNVQDDKTKLTFLRTPRLVPSAEGGVLY